MNQTIILVALLGSQTVHAEERIGLATNLPLQWASGSAYGLSGYVAVADHQAIRANVATWVPKESLGELATEINGGEGIEFTGRTTDLSIGWMYFTRAVADGFSVEVGALRRARDFTARSFGIPDHRDVITDSRTYAGRALFGWTWNFNHAFVSAAVGVSLGYERGAETTEIDHMNGEPPMTTTADLNHAKVDAEAFMRTGFVIDL